MTGLSPHLKGLLLAGAGVLVLSPDSLLVRLIGADPWTLLFWRGLLLFAALFLPLCLYRGPRVWDTCRRTGKAGLLAGALLASSTLCFVQALTHTTVANTLIIIGAGPLAAALLGRLFLKEPVATRTWLAIGAALTGIWITVSGDLEGGHALGNLCAGGTALSYASYLVVLRRTRGVDMTPAVALGGLLAAVVSWPLATPLAVTSGDAIYLGLLGLLVLPASFYLISLGPRFLPAPEVNLILQLEIVLGPYWVWLFLGEIPATHALIGGMVVLATLTIHSAIGLRRTDREN
jgi:drug/metabolite transporter (DMT)-like permease